jgi:hypothetical protein
MIAAYPTQLSLPALRALCVVCVKYHLQPRPAQSPRFTAKSRRIRTYAKYVRSPCRMNTSKTKHLKPFRMSTYEKTPGGTPCCQFVPADSPVSRDWSVIRTSVVPIAN